jgi:predicted DCC family thiol-disulfide oxidoreductase YuxK
MTKRPSKLLVFVDGECSVCRVTSGVLGATDRARCAEVVSYREDTRYREHGIDDTAAATRLQVVDLSTGQTHAGFAALRRLAREVPLLCPARPVLALLSALGLGDKLYDFIAKHRPTKREHKTSNA